MIEVEENFKTLLNQNFGRILKFLNFVPGYYQETPNSPILRGPERDPALAPPLDFESFAEFGEVFRWTYPTTCATNATFREGYHPGKIRFSVDFDSAERFATRDELTAAMTDAEWEVVQDFFPDDGSEIIRRAKSADKCVGLPSHANILLFRFSQVNNLSALIYDARTLDREPNLGFLNLPARIAKWLQEDQGDYEKGDFEKLCNAVTAMNKPGVFDTWAKISHLKVSFRRLINFVDSAGRAEIKRHLLLGNWRLETPAAANDRNSILPEIALLDQEPGQAPPPQEAQGPPPPPQEAQDPPPPPPEAQEAAPPQEAAEEPAPEEPKWYVANFDGNSVQYEDNFLSSFLYLRFVTTQNADAATYAQVLSEAYESFKKHCSKQM